MRICSFCRELDTTQQSVSAAVEAVLRRCYVESVGHHVVVEGQPQVHAVLDHQLVDHGLLAQEGAVGQIGAVQAATALDRHHFGHGDPFAERFFGGIAFAAGLRGRRGAAQRAERKAEENETGENRLLVRHDNPGPPGTTGDARSLRTSAARKVLWNPRARFAQTARWRTVLVDAEI